ncbi:MAG TPA: gliding motility-associated C-terminal domain-containing protein [Bacteroidia bacterium]|nr:gliding motility-associated C-terminal domain-containing protein [Bacteroidia bacterium]
MKCKRIFILIFFTVIPFRIFSQNLVPNPSFEVLDTCPPWSAYIRYAVPWFDPVPTYGGSDYFNSCAPPPAPFSVSVPFNSFGFQYARTGNAYAGLVTYYNVPDAREYIEVQLFDSLRKGKHYCGGFYVNNPECMWPIIYAEDKIGMYFSSDSVVVPPNFWYVIPVIPQIENQAGNIIYDTLNWVLISGIMKADGGERFITIGNFRDDGQTLIDTVVYPRPSFCDNSVLAHQAYYFIDDVFVEEMQVDTANAGGDKDICEGDSVLLGVPVCDGCIYLWQAATDLSDSTVAQPLAIPTQTTTYILLVRDTTTGTLCDWTSIDTVTVFVEPPCPLPEQPIEVYNIFTPNGDTKNEVFYVKNLPANSSLQIFNRWGSKVYESSNYQNNWDGGKVPDGTYFYLLIPPQAGPTKETHHGFVEIRR